MCHNMPTIQALGTRCAPGSPWIRMLRIHDDGVIVAGTLSDLDRFRGRGLTVTHGQGGQARYTRQGSQFRGLFRGSMGGGAMIDDIVDS